MRKFLEISFLAVAMVLMTTLSLLPHHHHGCSEAICLMPQHCEKQSDECDGHHACASEEDHHANSEEHCSWRVIDMSTAKSSELVNSDSQPIILFLYQPELVVCYAAQQVGQFEIAKTEVLPQQFKHPILGLRAPPMA
ncbi:MAG: hypothetical protein J6R48_01445 [Muribaculaceae bacterium]|nr:hypothetical protein [Muribaculaceae bacterium]